MSQVAVLELRVSRLESEAEIVRRLAAFDDRHDRAGLYRFVELLSAEYPVRVLCRVVKVSTSAFYAWRSRGDGPSEADLDEAYLADRIFDVWHRSRRVYGSPRVFASLVKAGVAVSEKRVARLMSELGISGKCGRRKMRTTWRDRSATPAEDLVDREFVADRPDRLWVGDITYIPTGEGWMYVASVLDVYSRLLVGWSIADHMRTDLVADAMTAAAGARGKTSFGGETVFHSDHGCQYTSNDFKALCARLGVVQSMGSVGDSYDNAMAESFWASLKRELVDDAHFSTKDQARREIFEWITWYNGERLHSSMGYVSPREFEEMLYDQLEAA